MAEDLETRAGKAVLKIEKKVNSIYAILKDVGMKLAHVIERKSSYYNVPEGFGYEGRYFN